MANDSSWRIVELVDLTAEYDAALAMESIVQVHPRSRGEQLQNLTAGFFFRIFCASLVEERKNVCLRSIRTPSAPTNLLANLATAIEKSPIVFRTAHTHKYPMHKSTHTPNVHRSTASQTRWTNTRQIVSLKTCIKLALMSPVFLHWFCQYYTFRVCVASLPQNVPSAILGMLTFSLMLASTFSHSPTHTHTHSYAGDISPRLFIESHKLLLDIKHQFIIPNFLLWQGNRFRAFLAWLASQHYSVAVSFPPSSHSFGVA